MSRVPATAVAAIATPTYVELLGFGAWLLCWCVIDMVIIVVEVIVVAKKNKKK